MKIACIGDIHSHEFNEFSRNLNCKWSESHGRYVESEDGELVLNSRLFNILSGLCDMRDYCSANDIKLVLNGGDTFNSRANLDVTTFNCTHRVLESFHREGIVQFIISGNHDNAINADNSPSSIETFKSFARVFTSPEVTEYSGLKLCMLPWTKNKESALKFINENCNKDSILLAHLGVSGATLGSSYVMSDDYSLCDLKPDKWKYVILGHYHHPQILHENTIYTGSPLHNDFGDTGAHGFWVIDTSKRWDMELIPLDYPEFKTLSTEELKEYPKDKLEKNFIRVQAKAKDVEDIQEELESIPDVRINIEKEYTKDVRSDINVSMSQEEILKTYVSESAPENADYSLLINKGIEIMKRAGGVD